jgi:uncharacterized membrane protein YfcA
MNWLDQAVLLAVAFVANGFSAFAGGGAGLLQLPALIFLGLPFATALATHKIATVALGLGATLRHVRERSLEARLAAFILVAGIPGVILGSLVILRVPGALAQIALGVLTLGLGAYSIFNKRLGLEHVPRNRHLRGSLVGGVVLFLIGVLNGSLSSGTGLFCTLWLIRWFGLDYRRAVAYTLVLVGLFWNGIGALTLGALGQVEWSWLPMLMLGSLLGGYAGAHWAIAGGNRWIKGAFEIVTILVGLKLLV